MMDNTLKSNLAGLTDIQRRAVYWDDGALLVLAGPGSGKTRVLTCRIARLLDESRDQRFRILALTFTNKAANEMVERVAALAPGLEARANINTFHGFCAQVLRQHGSHLGIKPDFAIYSRAADRRAVLEDALRREGSLDEGHDDLRFLPLIDHLKSRLVGPEQAEAYVESMAGSGPQVASRVAHAYSLYENELRRANALDFNSLIFEAHRLFAYRAMTRLYQTAYRYWLIDEFQDTNGAQYALLRRMAGESFRKVFTVADDDQTIYEWNGANVRRIGDLVKDFSCDVVQLPTNFRCPPGVVEAGNRLVVYNALRAWPKQPATAAEAHSAYSDEGQIQYREFTTDADEVAGVAGEIERLDFEARSGTAVLARTRALIEAMHGALTARAVPSVITTRRDDFLSPQMRWLVACLKQINRPLDRRNMTRLAEAFNGFASPALDSDVLVPRSEAEGINYLEVWTNAVRRAEVPRSTRQMVDIIANLSAGHIELPNAIDQVLSHFEEDNPDEDLKDDLSTWQRIRREIRSARGALPLGQFLQEMELRSKEPVPVPGTVLLMTIHGAKGLEFETVYLIGMAEEVLPSWHSVKKGDGSAAIEEERRGCFVAITRTRKRLVLSRARQYRGWPKDPSRFLQEMGCLDESIPGQAGDGIG